MATIRRFEDLEAWQHSRVLAKEVYKISTVGKFSRDFKLKVQINAAAGSAMDNIAEGFGRGGRNEFVNFLTFSTGSLNEVQSQLYRALDYGYLSSEEFESLYKIAGTALTKAGNLIQYLNKSSLSGQKFKGRTPTTFKPSTP